ncbi:MAG TPA: Tat pathway signal protein [Caulobacteraceae bacterium]|jgi:hypothetical protein
MNRRGLIVAGAALAFALPLAANAQESGQRKKGGGASFIELDPVSATVTRADGRRGVLTVDCGVDVPDAGLHARAAQSVPLLHAAYSEIVRTYAAGLPPGTPPNADYLSMALQRQTDKALGRPGAKLLLGTILVN